MMKPKVLENYDEHWKDITVKDRVVLDLGCDWGSTAEYFYNQGAKLVIGVDNDSSYANIVKGLDYNYFYFIVANINAKRIEDLVRVIRPDTVKVDCEGAEVSVFSVDSEILKIPSEWYFECHKLDYYFKIKELFAKLGYTVIDRTPTIDSPEKRNLEAYHGTYITLFICRRV